MKKNKAFTLAEVLLTLVIIGVISALTLPIIKKVSDEHAYVAGVKKSYMTLSTVVKDIKATEGPVKTWDMNNLKSYFVQKMNVVDGIPSSYTASLLNGGTAGNLDKFLDENSAFMTVDGALWAVFPVSAECFGNHPAYYKNACAVSLVDVNGKSAPNMVGVDIFAFYITAKDVLPFGSGQDVTAIDCATGSQGWTCASRIIKEGKISW